MTTAALAIFLVGIIVSLLGIAVIIVGLIPLFLGVLLSSRITCKDWAFIIGAISVGAAILYGGCVYIPCIPVGV